LLVRLDISSGLEEFETRSDNPIMTSEFEVDTRSEDPATMRLTRRIRIFIFLLKFVKLLQSFRVR
jgi:hypothetical protein